ncbi:hypothetical protein CEXT_51401 [Caerostris extrusa]|uniref:WAP domain-containing protein n=1 Tax=Caerostris extrusa TaxID=172846 RepID=A0AAV4SBM1_CAEEX|nr:hypothetical protein CEXT_51401 [Caerostris extrusa]
MLCCVQIVLVPNYGATVVMKLTRQMKWYSDNERLHVNLFFLIAKSHQHSIARHAGQPDEIRAASRDPVQTVDQLAVLNVAQVAPIEAEGDITKVCPKQPMEGCANHVTTCCDSKECKKGEVCCFQEEGCKTACMKPLKDGMNGAIFFDKDTCEDFKKAPKNITKIEMKALRSSMML